MEESKFRVFLLNPPYHKYVIRDNLCSFTAKTSYLWPPSDLLYLSASFGYEGAEIRVTDAVASSMSPEDVHSEIQKFAPHAICMLTGSVSHREDMAFVSSFQRISSARIYVTGNLPVFEAAQFMRNYPVVHGVIHDFFDIAAIRWIIRGGHPPLSVSTVSHEGTTGKGHPGLPDEAVPAYVHFPMKRYHIPFMRKKPLVSALASFGCPYRCRFCVAGVLPYRRRSITGMLNEFKAMKEAGIREIFFEDPVFNFDAQHTEEICDALRSAGGFSWSANIHASCTSAKQLDMMKAAGCHTVMIGAETGDPGMLSAYAPSKSYSDTFRAVDLCRKAGIRTLGYFILGFPEETPQTARSTIDLAIKLNTDWASFTLLTPDFGTSLRSTLDAEGKLYGDSEILDSTAHSPFIHECLSETDLRKYLRRAYRKFYLRPRKILTLAFSSYSVVYGFRYLAAAVRNRLL